MEYSGCSVVLALIAVFMAVRGSAARDLPHAGLLDEMPEKCSGAHFCHEKHANYPQEKIDELLTKKYNLTLGSFHGEPINRDGADEEHQDDCEKTVTYGEIYEIVDEHDNVRVVVQSPKIFKQQLRVEQCVNPGRLIREGGTDHFDSEELKDNDIFCVDKEMDYSFLVLTPNGTALESVRSKHGIPVCCSCRLRF